MKLFSKIISTWFLLGMLTKAPGTIGSLAALLFSPLILLNGPVGMIIIFAIFLLGLWSITNYMRYYGTANDPKEVVIDEVIGQLLTIFLTFITLRNNVNVKYYFSLYFACFIFFRFFDIVKIWPISFIDRKLKGALGIILDDVLAAVFAYFSIILLYYLL
ncbi:MAG: phosphatidylglycerophosphatase A [Candidatus Mesenet longicola]|uniref:Phosphatidylglycerophosphatase A n=1 Tax=Candidatus Mesenet longicola TaxID=1892558 RepID=A0A8J3HYD1_9RICK|nr:MAG: phosphatidylglycerophosphatase A [Candidatus Mesenet longicola]GHM59821.1 MAG: phosphatidylglycerophosphatase A [Candidatus Mesenet longicola]